MLLGSEKKEAWHPCSRTNNPGSPEHNELLVHTYIVLCPLHDDKYRTSVFSILGVHNTFHAFRRFILKGPCKKGGGTGEDAHCILPPRACPLSHASLNKCIARPLLLPAPIAPSSWFLMSPAPGDPHFGSPPAKYLVPCLGGCRGEGIRWCPRNQGCHPTKGPLSPFPVNSLTLPPATTSDPPISLNGWGLEIRQAPETSRGNKEGGQKSRDLRKGRSLTATLPRGAVTRRRRHRRNRSNIQPSCQTNRPGQLDTPYYSFTPPPPASRSSHPPLVLRQPEW